MSDVRLSKTLSFVLRHKPSELGISLDRGGWVSVNELVDALTRAGHRVDRARIEHVVATNAKQRFAISADGLRIRAVQGHSIDVDLGLETRVPPDVLFHGTATRFLDSILASGLDRRARHFVHLSRDRDAAAQVGRRHGTLVVLGVAATEMHARGLHFYLAENGVWLTGAVPPEFLTVLEGPG